MRKDLLAAKLLGQTTDSNIADMLFRYTDNESHSGIKVSLTAQARSAGKKLSASQAVTFAANINDPAELLAMAKKERRVTVLRALASNPNITDEIVEVLVKKSVTLVDSSIFGEVVNARSCREKVTEIILGYIDDDSRPPLTAVAQAAAMVTVAETAQHLTATHLATFAKQPLSLLLARLIMNCGPEGITLDDLVGRDVAVEPGLLAYAAGDRLFTASSVDLFAKVVADVPSSMGPRTGPATYHYGRVALEGGKLELTDEAFSHALDVAESAPARVKQEVLALLARSKLNSRTASQLLDVLLPAMTEHGTDINMMKLVLAGNSEGVMTDILNRVYAECPKEWLRRLAPVAFVYSDVPLADLEPHLCDEAFCDLIDQNMTFARSIFRRESELKVAVTEDRLKFLASAVRNPDYTFRVFSNEVTSWFEEFRAHREFGARFDSRVPAEHWRLMLDLLTERMLAMSTHRDGVWACIADRAAEMIGTNVDSWETFLVLSENLGDEPISDLLTAVANLHGIDATQEQERTDDQEISWSQLQMFSV